MDEHANGSSDLVEYYIDNQADFELACARLASSKRLAIDTEFERRNTYYPIFALLQIANDKESLLIDPLKIDDWAPLRSLFDSDTLILMHSCSEDLEVFRKDVGAQPKNLIDTQVACAFLGKGDALGYANMVMQMRSVEIDKTETRSYWLQRPLTASQQAYAREDVRWLIGIYAELESELVARERLHWVEEECAILRDRYWREPEIKQQWLRIKGLGRTDPKTWPLVFALASWREDLCRRLDKPRGWIMKDPELLEISRRRPLDKQQLQNIKGVTQTTLQRNDRAVMEITNRVDLVDPELTPLPELDAEQRVLLKSCQKVVMDKSEQLELSARFIANKQDLSELIQFHAGNADNDLTLSSGWRFELIGQELNDLVANA